MLFPRACTTTGSPGGHVLDGQVEQVIEHALAEHHLGRQRPRGPRGRASITRWTARADIKRLRACSEQLSIRASGRSQLARRDSRRDSPLKPPKERLLPLDPIPLPHRQRAPGRQTRDALGTRPPNSPDAKLNRPRTSAYAEPDRQPERNERNSRAPPVFFHMKIKRIPAGQLVAPPLSQLRLERAESPVIGDRLRHVVAPIAGHPAAEPQVEVFDPAGEVRSGRNRRAPGTCGDRRPAPARPRRSGLAGRYTSSKPGTRHIPWTSPNRVRTRVRIPS